MRVCLHLSFSKDWGECRTCRIVAYWPPRVFQSRWRWRRLLPRDPGLSAPFALPLCYPGCIPACCLWQWGGCLALPCQPDVVGYRWVLCCLHVPRVLPTISGKHLLVFFYVFFFFFLYFCISGRLGSFYLLHRQSCLPVSFLSKILSVLFMNPCPCLLQSIQRKFGSITHSSVRFLGERLQRMGNQFLSSLEVMTSRSQCPTVLLDAETVRPFSMFVYW